MKVLISFLVQYFRTVNKLVLTGISLVAGAMIALNYSLGIETSIRRLPYRAESVLAFFLLYAFLFITAYALSFLVLRIPFPRSRMFYFMLLLGPLLFAFKIGYTGIAVPLTSGIEGYWKTYWAVVLDWPLRTVILLMAIIILWRASGLNSPVAGLSLQKKKQLMPYLGMLALMIPLLAFAASRPEFQQVYPKMQRISFLYDHVSPKWPWQGLYELAYGTDFFSIELFFRGLLVLFFARYAGKDAILPMALFYCSIHFGKPLFECISSFPGGILLGIVVYHTRSIWGGLLVHLGIAWLMELAGYIAHQIH